MTQQFSQADIDRAVAAAKQTVADNWGWFLALGIVLAKSALRYASLGVLVVAVLKVFLFDMAGLTGLYRVGSFLGLGLALIGIGFVYQRFVFPSPAAKN